MTWPRVRTGSAFRLAAELHFRGCPITVDKHWHVRRATLWERFQLLFVRKRFDTKIPNALVKPLRGRVFYIELAEVR